MAIDRKKSSGLGIIFAALVAGPAFAQGLTGWEPWDMDKDGALNQDEFNQSWASNETGTPFSALDADNDGMINESEYNAGMYNYYDRNRDGKLDELEAENFGRDRMGGYWEN